MHILISDCFRVGLLLEMFACLVLARVGMVDPEGGAVLKLRYVENLGTS